MIRIRPSAYILAAILVLLVPMNWLCALLLASAIHEAGHLVAIYMTGGKVEAVSIGFCGAQIHTVISETGKEFFCAAAGPLASMLLLLLSRFFPKIAICGMIQAVFNLIPVYPMDGGRMLHCLLRWIWPRKADRIIKATEILALSIIFLISLAVTFRLQKGLLPVLCCVTVFARLLFGKIPCKSRKTAVQ